MVSGATNCDSNITHKQILSESIRLVACHYLDLLAEEKKETLLKLEFDVDEVDRSSDADNDTGPSHEFL